MWCVLGLLLLFWKSPPSVYGAMADLNTDRCDPKQVYLTLGDDYSGESYLNAGKRSSFLVNCFTKDPCQDMVLTISSQNPPFNYTVNHESRQLNYDSNNFRWKNLSENVTLRGYFHFFHVSIISSLQLKKTQADIKFLYTFSREGKTSFSKMGKVPSPSDEISIDLLLFADFDDSSFGRNTWDYLKNMNRTSLTSLFFLGDLNYEFWQNNGSNFARFFDKLSTLPNTAPLMIIPGNHEENMNYSFFDQRVQLPLSKILETNRFSSWNLGVIHFIYVELNFFNNGYKAHPENSFAVEKMMTLLEADLKLADSDFSRASRPWIVVLTHKPLYCTSSDYCKNSAELYSSFESLFYKYNVDLILSGHIHASELVKPMYKGEVKNFSLTRNGTHHIISDARGTIQFINGNSGSFSGYEKDVLKRTEARFFYETEKTGVGKLIARNKTHLLLETIETPKGTVKHSFWLTKTVLRPFHEDCSISGMRFRLINSFKAYQSMRIILSTKDSCPLAKFIFDEKLIPVIQEENPAKHAFQHQLHIVSVNLSTALGNKLQYKFLGGPDEPLSLTNSFSHSVPNKEYLKANSDKKLLVFGRLNRSSYKIWKNLLAPNLGLKNFSSVVVLSEEGIIGTDSTPRELFSRVPSYIFDRNHHFLQEGELVNNLDIGKAHIIFFDLRAYNERSEKQKLEMINWLEQDLEEADTDEHRKERPWVIVMCPKSFYCKTTFFCGTYNKNYSEFYKLFQKYSVDLIITTEHSQTKAFTPLGTSKWIGNYDSQGYSNILFRALKLSHQNSSQTMHINLMNNIGPLLINQGNAFSFEYTNKKSSKTSSFKETLGTLKLQDKLRYDIYTKGENGEDLLMTRINLNKDQIRPVRTHREKNLLSFLLSLFIYLAVVGLHGFILIIVFIGYGKRWRWASRIRTRVVDLINQEDSKILAKAKEGGNKKE